MTRRVAELGSRGISILDLTSTNPTLADLPYPPGLLDGLAAPEAQAYAPHPFGSIEARRAVAADYRRRGVDVPAERVVLTASTSEAYGLLFKLLCDAGDEVLVPQPSYPLFEHLTSLEAVAGVSYPLVYTGRWHIDAAALERQITPRTRAIVVVSPNNPTGSLLAPGEAHRLLELCRAHALALILDEVFADYILDEAFRLAAGGSPAGSEACAGNGQLWPVLSQSETLVFGLGGLSKTVGLPQVKLAWVGVDGAARLVEQALARLEVICDAYLSVGTPVQHAVGRLLAEGTAVRNAIRHRVQRNLATLSAKLGDAPACSLLPVEGGWSAVVRVPAIRSEEALVLALLEEQHVLVHPGFFYDFPHEAFLVLSLLPAEPVFEEGCSRLVSLLRSLDVDRDAGSDRVPLAVLTARIRRD